MKTPQITLIAKGQVTLQNGEEVTFTYRSQGVHSDAHLDFVGDQDVVNNNFEELSTKTIALLSNHIKIDGYKKEIVEEDGSLRIVH